MYMLSGTTKMKDKREHTNSTRILEQCVVFVCCDLLLCGTWQCVCQCLILRLGHLSDKHFSVFWNTWIFSAMASTLWPFYICVQNWKRGLQVSQRWCPFPQLSCAASLKEHQYIINNRFQCKNNNTHEFCQQKSDLETEAFFVLILSLHVVGNRPLRQIILPET